MNLKVFIGACVLSGLVACSSVKQDEAGLSRPGVSLELAQFRKEHFSNVRYNLFFSIPESRDEAIRGKVELSLRLDEKQPQSAMLPFVCTLEIGHPLHYLK